MVQIGGDNRGLHKKSRLHFHYINGDTGARTVVRLPFFENIKVTEEKSARWKKFNVISRSSDLYAYLGADSRKLELTFSMTLLHIQSLIEDIGRSSYIDYNVTPSDPIAEFKNPTPPKKTDTYSLLKDSVLNTNPIQPIPDPLVPVTPTSLDEIFNEAKTSVATTLANGLSDAIKYNSKLTETIMFWVNIVRTCVSNNAKNPSEGPPILRLSHGVMYDDIPCIATSVSIESDILAGYDKDTLLPRKIDVVMSLEEFRMGNLGEYEEGVPIFRDNLAGWEAVLSTGTTDPRSLK
tara:strand:+ start:584 stop:1462 length:879 start_codon:yes stop_codon:yes gene_type:complete